MSLFFLGNPTKKVFTIFVVHDEDNSFLSDLFSQIFSQIFGSCMCHSYDSNISQSEFYKKIIEGQKDGNATIIIFVRSNELQGLIDAQGESDICVFVSCDTTQSADPSHKYYSIPVQQQVKNRQKAMVKSNKNNKIAIYNKDMHVFTSSLENNILDKVVSFGVYSQATIMGKYTENKEIVFSYLGQGHTIKKEDILLGKTNIHDDIYLQGMLAIIAVLLGLQITWEDTQRLILK